MAGKKELRHKARAAARVEKKHERGVMRRTLICSCCMLGLAIPAAGQSPAPPVVLSTAMQQGASSPATETASPAAQGRLPGATSLTRREAEALALQKNPQITVGRLRALMAGQYVREQKSALLPAAYLSL